MKLRCELNVNGGYRKPLFVAGPNEPDEHLALKLAGYLLFWDHEPIVDASAKTPALAQFDFLPDVLVLDAAGDIKVWVECGSTTMNKLLKLCRRVPEGRGRIVVLKENRRDAERLRKEVEAQLDKPHRVEILYWPDASFRDWCAAVGEKTEIYGEASETGINAVVNERPVALELSRA
jgi:hypothetical protein